MVALRTRQTLRENPEESLLRHESQREAVGSVDKFLTNLRANVREQN
jgi:hypothetical protein